MQIDGSGRVQLVRSMPVLRPDEQVLQLMLDGWRNQQLSRNLQFATIEQRLRCVQRFLGHVNEDPWNWTPTMVEEFSADLRTVKHVSHSTLRGYHSALRAFTSYISNPDYGWDRICEKYFGTHPAQVFFDWNTAAHVQEYDGAPVHPRRDQRALRLRRRRGQADRQVGAQGLAGCLPGRGHDEGRIRIWSPVQRAAAPPDRRLRPQLSSVHSASARSVTARHGEARRTSHAVCSPCGAGPPGIVEDWLANGRGEPGTLDLFSSERGGLVVESTLIRRVRRYCEELGFSDGLDLHSFRRSYATHLLEAGWDPRFVQDQMGHEHASTTGIYQFVSDEFRRSTLRSALDRTVKEAMARGIEDGTS